MEGGQRDAINPLQTPKDKSNFSPFQSGLDVANTRSVSCMRGYKEASVQVSRGAPQQAFRSTPGKGTFLNRLFSFPSLITINSTFQSGLVRCTFTFCLYQKFMRVCCGATVRCGRAGLQRIILFLHLLPMWNPWSRPQDTTKV